MIIKGHSLLTNQVHYVLNNTDLFSFRLTFYKEKPQKHMIQLQVQAKLLCTTNGRKWAPATASKCRNAFFFSSRYI